MKIYSKNKAAEILGYNKSYFSTCSKTILRFSMLHGKGNLVVGYRKYEEYQEVLYKKFTDIYFSYDEPRDFSKSILNLYSCIEAADKAISDYISKIDPKLSIRGIKKIKKIIKSNHILEVGKMV